MYKSLSSGKPDDIYNKIANGGMFEEELITYINGGISEDELH